MPPSCCSGVENGILKSILTEVPYFLNIHYGDVNGDVIVFPVFDT